MSDADTPAYIGRKRCGCIVGMVVDDPKHPDITKKALKEFADDSLVIERVTVGFCREQGFKKCQQHSEQAKQSQPTLTGME